MKNLKRSIEWALLNQEWERLAREVKVYTFQGDLSWAAKIQMKNFANAIGACSEGVRN